MNFTRPTLTQLRQQARAFFAARLPGADSTLRRSIINVTADVAAALANGLYGYLDWIVRQVFASTADWDALVIEASEYGMSPNGPTTAAGIVQFSGTAGGTIPNDVVLCQDGNGNKYVTQAAATITGTTVNVAMEAVSGGSAGNLPVGAPLQLIYSLTNVNITAVVVADGEGNGFTGGNDTETIDSFRNRVLTRKQQPPQGGNDFDYVAWAKAIPGVTRAWIYPQNRGPGTVDLTFVMDGRDNIIPLSGDVATVQAAIDAIQPVTDDCVVFPPTSTAVNFTFTGVSSSTVRAAIEASVKDMFGSDAVPAGAFDPPSQTTLSGTLSFQDQIDPAVAAGAGSNTFTITAPTTDVTAAAGHILVPGTFTFS